MLRSAALLAVLSACAPAPAVTQRRSPPDSAVVATLEAVVRDGRTVGVTVGLLEADGTRRVFAHGSPGGGARPLDGESVFEIGSITKVFTGILLAEMARRGEVALTDPVARYVPAGARVPSRNGREITLLDLATHRSGLPKMPPGLEERDYASYSMERMYDFLSRYELPRDPDESYEYSNVGMALLGDVLARRAGKPYEALLRERVLAPLGLDRTAVTLTPEMERRLVRGHSPFGDPAPSWNLPGMVSAGSLRSDVQDMLDFAAAHLSRDTSAIHLALRDALRVQRAGEPGHDMGLGWEIHRRGDRVFAAHTGDTWGFGAFLALDLSSRRAAVVLTNAGSAGASGLEFHLLDSALAMKKRSVALPVVAAYRAGGADAAIRRYRELHATGRDAWELDEWALNSIGYWLLERGAVEDAVAILRLNVEHYPDAPNPHGSVGYALLRAGRGEEALEHYRRAVAVAEAADHPDLASHRANLERVLRELAARR